MREVTIVTGGLEYTRIFDGLDLLEALFNWNPNVRYICLRVLMEPAISRRFCGVKNTVLAFNCVSSVEGVY